MSRPRSNSRVRFAPRDEYEPDMSTRGRPQYTRQRPDSRDSSLSSSRSRSRSVSTTDHRDHEPRRPVAPRPSPSKKDKEWYHKKTLWSGLATVATVAALLPSAVSAKASVDAAHASGRAARASEKSARQVTKSARASEISAMGSIMSARAATNSSIAQGHMDEYGNCVKKDGYGRTHKVQMRPALVDSYSRANYGTTRRSW